MVPNRCPACRLAIIAVSLILSVAASARARQQRAADEEKAAELFTQAQAAEKAGDHRKAVTLFREANALVPKPIVRYRIAENLVHFDKNQAANEFKWYVNNGDPKSDEFKLAHQSLLGHVLPTLSPSQQKLFDLADDNLEAASVLGDKGEAPRNTSIELFEKLHKEQPGYLPVLLRLGAAYEKRKSYRDAARCYGSYLSAFERLGFDPLDQREIRRQKIECETLAKTPDSSGTPSTSHSADELKKLISDKCAVTIDNRSSKAPLYTRYHVSFKDDRLVMNYHAEHWSATYRGDLLLSKSKVGDIYITYEVGLKALNPARIQPVQNDNAEYVQINGLRLNIETSNSAPAINCLVKEQNYTVNPPRTTEMRSNVSSVGLAVKDKKSLNQVTQALKELIKLAGGKPELFEEAP